jgi:hypothetical protein
MSKNLHLIPKMPLLKDQKYDAGMGCLTLAKAGAFTVDITKRDGLHEGAPEKLAPFKRLTQEQVFAMPDVDDRKVYVKDHKERDKKEAEYNKERDAFNKKLHEELATLSWCWQTVQNGMEGQTMAHNTAQTKGLPADAVKSFTFPEVLEGGGLLWLEAFTQNDPATGKTPNGLFVRATGVPEIIRAVWTDLDCKPIIGKVKVGSKVLLNIYTKGLYGQDFEIGLWSQSTDNPETLLPIANKGNFRHEALTYKILPSEENKDGMSGGMLVEGKSESRVQKIRIPVTVNPIWMFAAPKGLAIYHTIKHLNTGLYFKDYKATAILDIAYDGKLHETVIEPTNNPLLVGKVETNVANFEPCQYTAIELINNKGEITELYKQDNAQKTSSAIETGVIVGSEKKKYTLQVDSESNTQECSRSITKDGKKVDDHHTKQLSVGNSLPSNVTVLSQTPAKIDFETWFDYSLIKLDHIWPTKPLSGNINHLLIKAKTCRHSNDINLGIYPDIGWKLQFKYSFKYPFSYDKEVDNLPKHALDDVRDKVIGSALDNEMAKDGELATTFNFKIAAEFDGGSEEYTHDFIDDIRKTLKLFTVVKQYVNDLAGKSNAKPKIGVSFEIKQPSIAASFAWKSKEANDKNGLQKVGIEIKAALESKPFIGAEITLDLLTALGTAFNPGVGKVISALKDFEYESPGGKLKIHSELTFDLTLSGDINLKGEVTYNTTSEEKSGILQGTSEIAIKVKLGYKLAGKVAYVVTAEVEGEASLEGEASISGGIEVGGDKDGLYLLPIAKFNGLLVTFVFKASISGGGFTKEFDKSPKDPITILPPYPDPEKKESIFDKIYLNQKK